MSEHWDGGCLCGAVRFSCAGKPLWLAWCHCESCRRHSGAAAATFVAFDESSLTMTSGEITKFASSPGMLRGFCSRCGSTLTCQGDKRPGELHMHVGAFDRAAELPEPAFHFFPEERLPWLRLAEPAPVR